MHSIALLGWFGAALSIALPWPQVWRSVIRGRTTGLSATACWQGTALPVGWITYGLLTGEAVQVVTNIVTGLAGLAVLVMVLVKQSELRTRRALTVSAAGAAAVLTAAGVSAAAGMLTDIGGARAAGCLGAVLAVTAILGAIPQPLSLLRDRSQDLGGLSPIRWWLAAAACSSWCAYGLLSGQPAVWSSALVGLSSALIVCWVLLTDRRTRAAAITAIPTTTDPATTRVTDPATTRVIHPATTRVVDPVTARVAHPVTARVAHPVTARVAHPVTARVIHPTAGRAAYSASARVAHPATVRTARPAAVGVAQPAAAARIAHPSARPARGTARVVRPASARPARGVARVPRSTDRATLIMSREFAPA